MFFNSKNVTIVDNSLENVKSGLVASTSQGIKFVRGNWIRGGGPSTSGGGINIGDYGGSYQITENNILVNPGQYGIGISGGNNMIMRNNKVYGKKKALLMLV